MRMIKWALEVCTKRLRKLADTDHTKFSVQCSYEQETANASNLKVLDNLSQRVGPKGLRRYAVSRSKRPLSLKPLISLAYKKDLTTLSKNGIIVV